MIFVKRARYAEPSGAQFAASVTLALCTALNFPARAALHGFKLQFDHRIL